MFNKIRLIDKYGNTSQGFSYRPSSVSIPTPDLEINSSKDNLSLVLSRNSTATVIDFEGVVRTAKSNEIRYEKARRVENLFAYSEDFSNSFWSPGNIGRKYYYKSNNSTRWYNNSR